MKHVKHLLYGTISLVALLVIAAAIWLIAPFSRYEYIRSSSQTEVLQAQFVNLQGDPLCTKIYLIDKSGKVGHGIIPRVPSDIPDPNKYSLKNGDKIILEGFLYTWTKTNTLTGAVTTKPSYRLDVLSWRDDAGNTYRSSQKDESAFKGENYTDCNLAE